MCGIAGILNTDGAPPNSEVLARMAALIAHRGPDGERFYFDGGLGFAHRHLRIIDLSDAAMQPMCNEDGTLWLIFNGEIYNYIELRPDLVARGHHFSSQSDTEVILHAYEEWGVECLDRLNGMFAFALWDARRKRLWIARDRMGVKPLYYAWRGGTLAFASEIKALLAHPHVSAEPNLSAIAQYMNAMYTTGDSTWFKGIRRLLPGHFMLVEDGDLSIRKWWDVPADEDEPGERPEAFYVDRTRELLEDSVRLRLRSDVPLGAHLSGGLDSSSIVALYSEALAGTGIPVRTFSGAFRDGAAYDERRYVRAVVDRYKTDHRETLPVADNLPALFDTMTWHMDEPAAGPGILLQYKVCELTRGAGVTVINGGQGGDEEWAGYFGYLPAYLRMLARQARHDPATAVDLARDIAVLITQSSTRKALIGALSTGRRGRLVAGDAVGDWAGPLFAGKFGVRTRHRAEQTVASPAHRTRLGQATYNDLKWYLPALLQVEDRTSMAFSLESRAPLLDYRLVEHAARTPGLLKIKDLEMKHVFREAVRDLLPPEVYRRTDKMGMPTPVAPWFRGSLAGWVRSELEHGSAFQSELLSRDFAQSALEDHLSGKRDRSIDLWKLLSVSAWWRVFIDGDATARAREAGQRVAAGV